MATYNEVLSALDFNDTTVAQLQLEGLGTADGLRIMTYEDLTYLSRTVMRNAPPVGTYFSMVSVKLLKAFKYWLHLQDRLGSTDDDFAFDRGEGFVTLERIKEVDELERASKDLAPTKPKAFKNMASGWTTWKEQWLTYLSQLRGAALIPLVYLCRDLDEPNDDMWAQAYPDEDARYCAITVFRGEHYTRDNSTMYTLLKECILDCPAWTFIKKFEKKKDGRGAFMALKTQCEGTSSILTRKNAAYASLSTCAFKGSTRHYTFQNYVTLHQKAHNELEELDEPVSETKKVSEFLKYISDPTLQMGLQIVMGDPAKLDNFELCQQYLSTLQTNTEQQRRNKRNISGVSGESQGSTKKPKDRYYSSEEWHELGSTGRDAVNELRTARGRARGGRGGGREGRGGRNGRGGPGRGGGRGGRGGRRTSAIDRLVAAMDRHYGVPAAEENDGGGDAAPAADPAVPNPRGGNAGNQFGRNAHGRGHAGR